MIRKLFSFIYHVLLKQVSCLIPMGKSFHVYVYYLFYLLSIKMFFMSLYILHFLNNSLILIFRIKRLFYYFYVLVSKRIRNVFAIWSHCLPWAQKKI